MPARRVRCMLDVDGARRPRRGLDDPVDRRLIFLFMGPSGRDCMLAPRSVVAPRTVFAGLVLASVTCGLAPSHAAAQCAPGWLPGEGVGGVSGNGSTVR